MAYYYNQPKKKPKKCRSYRWAESKAVSFIKNQLVQKNGAICALCGKVIMDKKDLTLDHIIPKANGGLTTIENCQLACKSCNERKGDALR